MDNPTELITDTVDEVEGNPVVGLVVLGTFVALATVGAYHVGTTIGNTFARVYTERKMRKMAQDMNATLEIKTTD